MSVQGQYLLDSVAYSSLQQCKVVVDSILNRIAVRVYKTSRFQSRQLTVLSVALSLGILRSHCLLVAVSAAVAVVPGSLQSQ